MAIDERVHKRHERSVACSAMEGDGSSTTASARSGDAMHRHTLTAATQEIYAALDLGTNNCRLLIVRPTPDGFRVIDAFSRIVRLGEGLAQSGQLSTHAIRRAIEALKVCAHKIRYRGVTHARLIATEACRQAINGATFCQQVKDETGLELEVVDRETEARLAAIGCAPLIDPQMEGAVLFDIGGGSSELVWLDRGKKNAPPDLKGWVSLPVGVVNLSEKYGGIDVTPGIYDAMVADVHNMLEAFPRHREIAQHLHNLHLLGTSGTVTTLAGVYLDLAYYERQKVDGIWLSNAATKAVIARLRSMSYEERSNNPCIGPERADLVLAGCAILDAIFRVFPCSRLRVADRGLREGMLLEMMHKDNIWVKRFGKPK